MAPQQSLDKTLETTSKESFAAEFRFQVLFDQAPTSMQLLALDGKTIQVNKAWRTLWEAPDESALSDYVLNGEYNVLTDPQLLAQGVTPYLERAFAGDSVRIPAIEYKPEELGKPGLTRWVTATAHPLKDQQGRVQEVVLMHEDITDRVEADRLLRNNEERFRSMVMATSLMVWSTTPEGIAYEDSPSWRAFTGQTREEWLNDGWLSAVHPDDREHASHAFKQSISNRSVYETEYRLRRADGHYCWTSAKAVPVFNSDGSVREWVGANSDISEAKNAVISLQISEARFRTITEAIPQMVWSTRPDGYHEYYNQKWYDFTGVAVGSTDGKEWKSIVHPDDQELTWKVWEHSLATGEPYEIQYRLRHHCGQYRWALGRALPIRDDSGKIFRWLGTCTEIHDQKMAEDALREAVRRKDEFLAMLAHELRNPLAPISAAAELMALAHLDPERIKQTSQIINRQVRHLTGLIDDLVDVSRVTRGMITIDKSPQVLKLIAANAVEQVMPLMEAKRHRLIVDFASESASVLGDEKRLVQVVTNLLHNAVRYTPEGGNIHLAIEVEGDRIALRVRDDGIGMAAELQPRVFDLFTQGGRSLDREQGGLGVGLALVKSLIELHGGDVTCSSAGIGKGSEFVVTLPCLPEGRVSVDKSPLDRPVDVKKPLKILAVDDNADALTMLAMYLETAGHDVVVEHTSGSALARATSEPPDVCILDIGLPGMDGYELASRLKAQPVTAHIKLVAVTGYGQEQDRQRGMEAGFDHHLVKPVDTGKLVTILAQISNA
jgi:PAS domain S-box-containing protein